MKKIASFEQGIGGDGGKLAGAVGVDAVSAELVAQVEARYPIKKVVEPAVKLFNEAFDKVEQVIPGDWDKPFVASIKAEFEQKLIAALAAE